MDSIEILVEVNAAGAGRIRLCYFIVSLLLICSAFLCGGFDSEGAFQPPPVAHAILRSDGRAWFARRMHLDLLAVSQGRASLLSQNAKTCTWQNSPVYSRLPNGECVLPRCCPVSGAFQTFCHRTRSFSSALPDVCDRHHPGPRLAVFLRGLSGSALWSCSKGIHGESEMGFSRVSPRPGSDIPFHPPPAGLSAGRGFSGRLKLANAVFQLSCDLVGVLVGRNVQRSANRDLHMSRARRNAFVLLQVKKPPQIDRNNGKVQLPGEQSNA